MMAGSQQKELSAGTLPRITTSDYRKSYPMPTWGVEKARVTSVVKKWPSYPLYEELQL